MQRITTFWRSGWIGKLALGLGAFILMCCVLSLVVSRFPTPPTASAPTAVVQAVAVEQATSMPVATAAPKPTDISKPTSTPAPTATPKPTATPTEIPSPTPIPEPIKLSGTGKVVTDKFTPPGAVNRITFDHKGQSNFIVHVFNEDGNEDSLVNVIGSYHGEVLLFEGGPVYFEVNADGPWSAVVDLVLRSDTPVTQLSGHGDTVSDAFTPDTSGAVPYVLTHSGERNFIVHLYCAGGIDSVENEIGKVNDQVVVRFSDGPCLWGVHADGDWSLAPK